jgi:hypothetical protein
MLTIMAQTRNLGTWFSYFNDNNKQQWSTWTKLRLLSFTNAMPCYSFFVPIAM